jgi:uncharacterized membrane-anchored protein
MYLMYYYNYNYYEVDVDVDGDFHFEIGFEVDAEGVVASLWFWIVLTVMLTLEKAMPQSLNLK